MTKLENAFRQFLAVRENIDQNGVGIDLRAVHNNLGIGLDLLAEASREHDEDTTPPEVIGVREDLWAKVWITWTATDNPASRADAFLAAFDYRFPQYLTKKKEGQK